MQPLENFFTNHIWITILIWALTYSGDYYLTILGAHLYRRYGAKYFSFSGSIEITPAFQPDVDALNLFSRRFLFHLIFSSGLILVFWELSTRLLDDPAWLYFLMGALLLRSAAVYLRHGRLISVYFLARHAGALRGQIEYARWLSLLLSALELFSFALLYLVLFILTGSQFLLGGALACTVTAAQHWNFSRQAKTAQIAAA